jgi:hypothetical protein
LIIFLPKNIYNDARETREEWDGREIEKGERGWKMREGERGKIARWNGLRQSVRHSDKEDREFRAA